MGSLIALVGVGAASLNHRESQAALPTWRDTTMNLRVSNGLITPSRMIIIDWIQEEEQEVMRML